MPARRIRRRPVGRPTAETAQLLESALLQVASELFQEKGFARTTMREISERAAASRQSLYARFPDKAALFEALMSSATTVQAANLIDFLFGARSNYALNAPNEVNYLRDWHFGYIQDDWKVFTNLTINAGLRYEFMSPNYEQDD